MSAVRPDCYGCTRKAAPGRMFCTDRCAADYGEALVRGNEQEWCVPCQGWAGVRVGGERLACGHVAAGIREGMKHGPAAALYRSAVETAAWAAAEDEISARVEESEQS